MANPRPANPERYDTWVGDDGELYVYDGHAWVPYLSPPASLAGGDPEPIAVERESGD
jgi:hypothetical protein